MEHCPDSNNSIIFSTANQYNTPPKELEAFSGFEFLQWTVDDSGLTTGLCITQTQNISLVIIVGCFRLFSFFKFCRLYYTHTCRFFSTVLSLLYFQCCNRDIYGYDD